MLEKRPTLGKAKRLKTETTIRRADGTTWQFPLDNPNAIELAKALTRRGKRRTAARQGRDDTTESIRERMRRDLAARERNSVSIQPSDVGLTHTAFPGGWVLDVQ